MKLKSFIILAVLSVSSFGIAGDFSGGGILLDTQWKRDLYKYAKTNVKHSIWGLTHSEQWLINYRVEKARELLRVPGASVTEVAFSVGYSSIGQFIAAFRLRTGRLPSEYLKYG